MQTTLTHINTWPSFLLPALLLFLSISGLAQSRIVGVVLDAQNTPIIGATVQVIATNKGAITDADGKFQLSLQAGEHRIEARYIGFKKVQHVLNILPDQTTTLRITFQQRVDELSEVVIASKTGAEQLQEKAFEVEVLETKELKNTNADINTILATIPGVNIRQRGGLGSDFSFSLNGLSGRQIKFFIDAIPLENSGSSLSLNNFPATLMERVEIYKGVVPIYLGADALGGAVNVVTNQRKNDFIDISYSLGSFNTHRGTFNGQYYGKKGVVVKGASFYNYSDNDYTIDDITVRDALGNDTGAKRNGVRRFHDAYQSQMVNVQMGLVDQSYADRLFLGMIASGNRNEIQHPIDPQNPFGEVFTKNSTWTGFLSYENAKFAHEKLKVKLYAAMGENSEKVVDTAARKYDWFGGFVERGDQNKGEFEFGKTLFEYTDKTHLVNLSAVYQLTTVSTLNFNYTKNYIKRQGEDAARIGRIPFNDPHVVDKNILGLSYDIKLFERRWNTTVFAKGYFLKTQGSIEAAFTNDFTDFDNRFEETGYGVASTFHISDFLQTKASFERTFRIPEGYESFGDGLLLKPNPELLPEQSSNVNLGVLFHTSAAVFDFNLDANAFLREAQNFIAIRSEGIFARYYNTAAARISGVEGAIGIRYNQKLQLAINATYQNSIDQNVGENARIAFLKNQRIPNIPYLFGNASMGYTTNSILAKNDKLTLLWGITYVHDYPLTSFVEGTPEERDIIPEQVAHNLILGYSFNEGMYNLSLNVRNVLDAKIYDNFQIQQPGRAFHLKFRYYLTN